MKQTIMNKFSSPNMIETKSLLSRIGPLMGNEVRTPDGIGILFGLDMPANGLYISHWQAKCRVWYGTNNGTTSWIAHEYNAEDVVGVDAVLPH